MTKRWIAAGLVATCIGCAAGGGDAEREIERPIGGPAGGAGATVGARPLGVAGSGTTSGSALPPVAMPVPGAAPAGPGTPNASPIPGARGAPPAPAQPAPPMSSPPPPPAAAAAPGGQSGAAVGGGPPVTSTGNCAGATLPPVAGDYGKNGPFQTRTVNGTGPDGQYTVVRPATLGQDGFKHPIATWGNGITTDPSFYPALLGAIASHGFVVIASNSSTVTAQLISAGLDWMVQQNAGAGDYQGKLNPTCLVTVGYSLGGGGAVGAGAHDNVVATVSMHGVAGASNLLRAPLLLLTSENDAVCVPAVMVTPTFELSTVQTFYGTMSTAGDTSAQGHLIPVDGALSLITQPAANLAERAAVIAWLRLWVYGDQGAKKYFYDDCILCKAPWVNPQRKNWK